MDSGANNLPESRRVDGTGNQPWRDRLCAQDLRNIFVESANSGNISKEGALNAHIRMPRSGSKSCYSYTANVFRLSFGINEVRIGGKNNQLTLFK